MRIAFVRKNYTPYGGAERYLAQLMERLLQEGHEVHVFAHRWDGKGRGPLFHRVPLVPSPSFLEALTFAFFSRRLLEQESFDVIHSFERTLYQDVYRAGDGCHREWLLQRRMIDPGWKRMTHPFNPLHRSLLFLEGRLFQSPRLKRIVANSRRGKREIMRHYGVRPEKIEVLYNGVDLEHFHPRNAALFREGLRRELKIHPAAPVLLFLGSGFRRKGLASLIAAWPEVRREFPEAMLLVAGRDPVHAYGRKARQLGVEEKILFLGPTGRARQLMAASDLFVLPTLYDPFSNACLEAMASGIPVLTSLQNGVAELIRDGENGFLLSDPADASQVTTKITEFLRCGGNPSLGARARAAAALLDIGAAVGRMLEIYEEIRRP